LIVLSICDLSNYNLSTTGKKEYGINDLAVFSEISVQKY
jgi:hypothetical protein